LAAVMSTIHESYLLHSWIIIFTSAKLPCRRLISSIIHSQLCRNPMGRF